MGKPFNQNHNDRAKSNRIKEETRFETVFEDSVGRIVLVDSPKHLFFVAHSWNDDSRKSFKIEGTFESQNDALRHLTNL